MEIGDAIENCSYIQLVVAHIGSGISGHAKTAVEELLADDTHGEERINPSLIDYDCIRVINDLRAEKAYEEVDTPLKILRCSRIDDLRVTYFGIVKIEDLVKLHKKYDEALYAKNIRSFLGHKTDVNISIMKTLATKPEHFFYLNNGVTALCQEIIPKGSKDGLKKLELKGFSVINGAQTIASSANFHKENVNSDISAATVAITLIKADSDGEFGKQVTYARNHQNPVLRSHFVALEDEQERLRCELAHLGIHYIYKEGAPFSVYNPNRIHVEDAAQALALFQPDPRIALWLKKEPSLLLNTTTEQYKALFNSTLTVFQLVNAVRFNRYVQKRMATEAIGVGPEKLSYKHGNFALGWVLAKRVKTAFNAAALFDDAKLMTELSIPFDQLRLLLWNHVHALISRTNTGPLALFRNQTRLVPFLAGVLEEHYGLATDPVVAIKRGQYVTGQLYPVGLFDYLISKAPQIGGLS